MSRSSGMRGSVLVAPLVATVIGLAALGGVATMLSQSARWVRRANLRVQRYDAADLVAQTFAFDLRRAGWSPTGTPVTRLAHAAADALEVNADLDGDGVVDLASAERLRWVYAPTRRTLSRFVGDQSMPIASDVSVLALTYLDDAGAALLPDVAGLTQSDLARIRRVVLTFDLTDPGGGVPIHRTVSVALRGVAS